MAVFLDYMEQLLQGEDLSFDQSADLLNIIFQGEVASVQIAAFLTAHKIKGYTSSEIGGFANSLRNNAIHVESKSENLLDTCGTGGAKIKTFNVSTAAAIVAAGAGVKVAKHGNGGITSSCGSADVLQSLGVNINASPEVIGRSIDECNIGFMFAPRFHPAMKYVQPVRKELGFRTVFNLLGPLANPAFANLQVMGVGDESLMHLVAGALKELGTERAMVMHAQGLDELSLMGPTRIIEVSNGESIEYSIEPEDLGFKICSVEDIKGEGIEHNTALIKSIFAGETHGPAYDIVVLNAAASIYIYGLADSLENAVDIARVSIDDGKARQTLEAMIEISRT